MNDIRKTPRALRKPLHIPYAMLVYQGGIANVFAVDYPTYAPGTGAHESPRNARRLMQSDFSSCIWFARGLAAAGTVVRTGSCNVAGDCADVQWTRGIDGTPFRDKAVNVEEN